MLYDRVTPERVAGALLKTPRLAFEVAPLLTWVAGPWTPVDGGHERKDPWGKVVAKTYDYERVSDIPLVLMPWKWVVWTGEVKEGYAAIDLGAMQKADAVLVERGWALVW